MKSPTTLRSALAAILALGLCACGSVEHRPDFQSMVAPIEVIEGNFVESTNDSEIVYLAPALRHADAVLAA